MQSDDQTRREALNLVRSVLGDKADALSEEAVELMIEFYAIMSDPATPPGPMPPRAKEILGKVFAETSTPARDESPERAAIRLALEHANAAAKIARDSFEASLAAHVSKFDWDEEAVRSARTAFFGHASDVAARAAILNMLEDPRITKRVDAMLLQAAELESGPSTREVVAGVTIDAMDTFHGRQHTYVVDTAVPDVERDALTRIGKAGL